LLQDPIVVLTLITVVLWLAVISWKLWRREQADGAGRGAARGAQSREAQSREAQPGPRGNGRPVLRSVDGPRRDPDPTRWDRDTEGWLDEAPGLVDEAPGLVDAAPGWDDEPPREAEKPRRFAGLARPQRAEVRPQRAEVEINPGKCMRFAFCEHEAPEIFKLIGDRIDYKPSVPADQIDAVAMAVKVCPARAIKMKVPGSKPYLPQPPVDDDERRPVRR
jgi:ferredoxin